MAFDEKSILVQAVQLTERLHRQCLEVVKGELDTLGVRDLNNIQALILFNIGEEELSIGELTQKGYYLGSNVSYNVKKMVEHGYLVQKRSIHDRRTLHVKVTYKGKKICKALSGMFAKHAEDFAKLSVDSQKLESTIEVMTTLLKYWSMPQHLTSPISQYA